MAEWKVKFRLLLRSISGRLDWRSWGRFSELRQLGLFGWLLVEQGAKNVKKHTGAEDLDSYIPSSCCTLRKFVWLFTIILRKRAYTEMNRMTYLDTCIENRRSMWCLNQIPIIQRQICKIISSILEIRILRNDILKDPRRNLWLVCKFLYTFEV